MSHVLNRPPGGHAPAAEGLGGHDVIDPRIDVSAQKALLRLKRNPATAADAAGMLAAVKSGQLQGIYGDDLRASAQLAARLGTVRWLLVPPGRVAALVREPGPFAPPTIIFRTQYRGDALRLDPALVAAYRSLLDGLYAAALGEQETEAFGGSGLADPGEFQVPQPADPRILVNDTLEVPFRFVCYLDYIRENPLSGDRYHLRGTGTLISDRHVLTAAHHVFDDMSRSEYWPLVRDNGQEQPVPFPTRYVWSTSMVVAPARNDRALPGRFSAVKTSRPSPQWMAAAEKQAAGGNVHHVEPPRQANYALLTLETPLGALPPVTQAAAGPAATRLGWWGDRRYGGGTRIRAYDAAALRTLRGSPSNLSGYPFDKCRGGPQGRAATVAELSNCTGHIPGLSADQFGDRGSTQWRSAGAVETPVLTQGMITYKHDGSWGRTGGPVWVRWEQARNLLAIHTGRFPATSTVGGVLITERLLRQLRAWLAADHFDPNF